MQETIYHHYAERMERTRRNEVSKEIEPDVDREGILNKVREYFQMEFEGEMKSIGSEIDMTELQSVIDSMDQNDYNAAYKYFGKEIVRLQLRIVGVSSTEIGRETIVPICNDTIHQLEMLRDSLRLSKKEVIIRTRLNFVD